MGAVVATLAVGGCSDGIPTMRENGDGFGEGGDARDGGSAAEAAVRVWL